MFTVSALSQACRPVSVARIQCLFELRLNNPPYLLGEPTTPLGLSGEPRYGLMSQEVQYPFEYQLSDTGVSVGWYRSFNKLVLGGQ